MTNPKKAPTQDDVDRFKYLSPMLDSALSEMREFSKKKQDGIVSAAKIKLLNRLLTDLKNVVRKEDSASYLEILSEEELPQNSDAVLILGQYRAVLDSFKRRNIRTINYRETWITKEWIDENSEEEYEDEPEDE